MPYVNCGPGTAVCCSIATYTPEFGSGWSLTLFFMIRALFQIAYIAGLAYTLATWRRRRALQFYFPLIWITIVSMGTGITASLLPFSAAPDASFQNVIYNMTFQWTLALVWFVELKVVLFMFYVGTEPYARRETTRRAAAFTFVWWCVIVIGVIVKEHPTFSLIAETVWFLVHMVALVASGIVKRPPRTPLMTWSLTLALCHLLFASNYVSRVLVKNAISPGEPAMCLFVVAHSLYYLVFPPLLYWVYVWDCCTLSKTGVLLLAEVEQHDDIAGLDSNDIDSLRASQAMLLQQDVFHSREDSGDASASSQNLQSLPDVLRTSLAGVPNIPLADLTIQGLVGSGQYGDVYKALWKSEVVACKKFRLELDDVKACRSVAKELAMISSLEHPSVLRSRGVVIDTAGDKAKAIYLVTDFMSRGSLFDVLGKSAHLLTPSIRLSILRDVAAALQYLHTHNPKIIHRDLKSPNLLLDADFNCHVADFGLSRVSHMTQTMTQAGTPQWMAPEVLRGERYSEKTDVFSFGVVAWELATGQKPYRGIHPYRVATMVAYEKLRLPTLPGNGSGKDGGVRISSQMSSLIKACWHEDMNKRPSFQEIGLALAEMDSSVF